MSLVLELDTNRRYLENSIINALNTFGIEASLQRHNDSLRFFINASHPEIQPFLAQLENELPASIFLKQLHHRFDDTKVTQRLDVDVSLPHSVGLCPRCHTELFNPDSRRYYYPFTHCNSCGNAHAFIQSYPFNRANSALKYTQPCSKCEAEKKSVGHHHNQALIGCHTCGVPVRLSDAKSERYANDASSYKTLFEVAAAALLDGKTLLLKSMMGYRLLSASRKRAGMKVLITDASAITSMFSLIKAEYHALLSIEHPVLHVAIKDESLQQTCQAKSIDVKYPDDGFTLLIAAQCKALGMTHLFYASSDAEAKADLVLDFDLPLQSEPDLHLLIHKEQQLLHHGMRSLLPATLQENSDIVSVAHGLVAVPFGEQMIVDVMANIAQTDASQVNVLDNETQRYHSNQKEYAQPHAMCLSVIHEYALSDALALCFEQQIHFFYFRRNQLIEVIPSQPFCGENLLERIASLRSGSDRLLHNISMSHPEMFAKLQTLEALKSATMLDVVQILLDINAASEYSLLQLALSFSGKGGVKIDMNIRDNRFDYTAMIASFLSYFSAGVEYNILAFSFFESLADYMNDVLQELMQKTSCKQFVLCGDDLAYHPLFSRLMTHLQLTPPLISRRFSVGKESAVVGGLYC